MLLHDKVNKFSPCKTTIFVVIKQKTFLWSYKMWKHCTISIVFILLIIQSTISPNVWESICQHNTDIVDTCESPQTESQNDHLLSLSIDKVSFYVANSSIKIHFNKQPSLDGYFHFPKHNHNLSTSKYSPIKISQNTCVLLC